MESLLFGASLCSLALTIVVTLIAKLLSRRKLRSDGTAAEKRPVSDIAAWLVALLSLLIITIFIISRAIRTGHGPFTNMYEFSVAFSWGILLMSLYFSWRYRNVVINLFGAVAGAALLLFARGLSGAAAPLVPALQNSLLLSAHVFSAVIAYGSFTIGLIASVLFLIQLKRRFSSLPNAAALEKLSYHTVIIGFPFMTLVIVLGAVWADIAWGSFWSWDPKETASLVTWLIYTGYMHTRIMRKWQGKKSAVLLIIGFVSVVFTFFGNYLFSGLHAYN